LSPRRLLQPRFLPLLVSAIVTLTALLVGAWALDQRTRDINRILYAQCVSNELQDAVLVSELRAAKIRAAATLPHGSAILEAQLQILNDGIEALEPTDEKECQPPRGWSP
jgi:hypothetical protein